MFANTRFPSPPELPRRSRAALLEPLPPRAPATAEADLQAPPLLGQARPAEVAR